MKDRYYLFSVLVVLGLLAACPQPAGAYIKFEPPTLGDLCRQATHIYVLKVERVDKPDAEKGVILFKAAEQLKSQVGLPDGAFAKQVIAPNVTGLPITGPNGAKVILDWAAEGKTAVLFAKIDPPSKKSSDPPPERLTTLEGNVRAHVYIEGYWYWVYYDGNRKCWTAVNGEVSMLTRYCGPADKLGDAVTKILRGEEVVVPAMVGDNKRDLEERRAKVQDLRASLTILDADPKGTPDGEKKPDGKKPEPTDKKPEDKKPVPGEKPPEGKKGEERKPDRFGTVKAIATDGKSFTLQPAPTEKNKEPASIDIQIGEGTKITNGSERGTLAVGQTVSVYFAKGSDNVAQGIQIGKPPEKKPEEKKPEPTDKKPEEKKPDLVGTIKAVSTDGKSFTLLQPPAEKGKEPTAIDIQLGDAKITSGKEPGKLAAGQTVSVWLAKGEAKLATTVLIGTPAPPEKKPLPPDKPPEKKPEEPKPETPKKPKEPAKPARDPSPTAAVIDTEIDKQLTTLKLPASPQADDAEFLRRVYLDLTGRIPTYQQTVDFLDSKDPDKRRKLIDELLESQEYGEHFGTVWRSLLAGRELNVTGKGGTNTDTFRSWLAEQFNDNRGWDAIVTDLLTAEGTLNSNPATAFLLTNGENGQPRANKAAGATAALFWGVNLRCAECHNHPFAKWKQPDFWGTAAFFGKVQYSGPKGGGQPSLAEVLGGSAAPKEKGQPGLPAIRGTAIVIPTGSGKAAGQAINARFLGANEPTLDENEPFRPRFAAWATAADNPFFARAAVNRMWAHFFGRGFVNPLDSFEINSPSHPELLDRLAKEFADSGFDLKHLARSITTSKAYQRTSRPVAGNEADSVAFSHMAVKVLTPEVLYDALGVVGKGGVTDSGKGGKGSGDKQESRELFLRSFRIDEEATTTDYIQGIPQLLRVMNASTPNRGSAVVDKVYSSKVTPAEAITTFYLTVLSRRPTTEETELMTNYLSRRKDEREGYRGVMWILLNSSEFALNR